MDDGRRRVTELEWGNRGVCSGVGSVMAGVRDESRGISPMDIGCLVYEDTRVAWYSALSAHCNGHAVPCRVVIRLIGGWACRMTMMELLIITHVSCMLWLVKLYPSSCLSWK
jgi:hypothetical protein